MITYQYTQKDWTTFKEGIKREWAVTNGIGGYAGSSMIGAHSRTHQGYLIASLHAPIERYLVFSKINETATVGTRTVSFETSQHRASGKTVYTDGQKFLTSFIYDGSVHYTYETDNFSFEKHITLKRNANVCAVSYELTAGDNDCTFTLTPLFNYREHSESSTPDTLRFETFTEDRTFYLVPEKKKDMPSSGQLRLNDPIRWLNYAEEVTIKEDGSFQVQTDVITVTPATLVFPFAQIPCLLAPGKESTIIVNTAECSRQQSHLQKDNKPYGKKAYYGGYLADLQQELSDNSIPSNLVDNPSKIVKDVAGKDINGLKDYFLEKRLNTYKQIDEASLSSAAKEILKANTDITTAIGLFMGKDIIMRAHVVSQKLNREQTKEYYTNTKIEFPVDYLDVLKDFTLNEPVDLYAPEFAYGAGIFSSRKDLMEEKLGTNQGILFQMGEAYKCYRSIEDFTPLTAEQKAVLEALPSPAYKQLLTVLNDKLLKKIELNKQKTGYKINEIGKVTNEELFSTIISKFRGHVLLVDFWATWCGPCRMANKAMIPMKEELKDEDILYLYITGETSPKGTWENMIPDIHGEHFRVTNDQWAYLMSTFKIGGVPTYFVIDAEGNTTFKQTGFPGTDTMKKQLMKALKK